MQTHLRPTVQIKSSGIEPITAKVTHCGPWGSLNGHDLCPLTVALSAVGEIECGYEGTEFRTAGFGVCPHMCSAP